VEWRKLTDAGSPKHSQRRIRLSVRALMILIMIVGGGLGRIVHRARVQRDIVAAIDRAGGSVDYDWEWTDGE
jgi:hypothetical protein